jgi:solute carrier family 25 carnitine/acylcarnitine transporter 20/29
MSKDTLYTSQAYPEPPTKKRNDLLIELIAGSVGGATQVLVGQVSQVTTLRQGERLIM